MHRVDVQLEDDLTGGPADETIQFSLDGRSYEIDLNSRHASEFRDRLVPFTDHARLVRPQRSRVTVRSAASRERSRQIRLWAEQRGYALSPHGRLPGSVIQQYDREHGADRQAEPTRRRAGQRSGPSRQARKTGASTRSPRQRSAPRGALRRSARRPGPQARRLARQPGPHALWQAGPRVAPRRDRSSLIASQEVRRRYNAGARLMAAGQGHRAYPCTTSNPGCPVSCLLPGRREG
jgi:nucleoid-associated protein Lsr2